MKEKKTGGIHKVGKEGEEHIRIYKEGGKEKN